MLEAALEKHFRKTVKDVLHGKLYKLVGTKRGMPDRLVLLPNGRLELVELKTDTGRLSPIQIEWHQDARTLGTEVTVLYGRGGVDLWAEQRGEPKAVTVHECPPNMLSTTLCCGKTPFELPVTDRITVHPDNVTCKGSADPTGFEQYGWYPR